MTKQITVCDGCGEDISRTSEKYCRISVNTDLFFDGAGSRDYNSVKVDMCRECAETRLLPTLEKLAGITR